MNVTTISTENATPAAAVALIERKPLMAALQIIARGVVEARNTIPILSAIMIEATEGGARLTGTDLDLVASITLPAAWEAPATWTPDARELLTAVKAVEGDTVRLEENGGALIVAGDGVSSRVALIAGEDDFPVITKVSDKGGAFALPVGQLFADIGRVRPAVSTEETRYYLNGIFIHALPGATEDAPASLAMAATDGHRLMRVVRAMPPLTAIEGDDAFQLPDAIIPRKALDVLAKLIGAKEAAGDVAIAIDKTKVQFSFGGWTLLSKLIDGTFPDYRRVIPSCNALVATFDAADLSKVAGKLAKAGGKETRAAKLSLGHGHRVGAALSCGGAAAGVGASWRTVTDEGDVAGPSFEIGMNAGYLATMADAFGTGLIVANMADAATPILFTSPDAPELTGVLMSMRVDGVDMPETVAPRSFQPVETAADVFERTYGEAFVARDGDAMRTAVGLYGGTFPDHVQPERIHYQLAMIASRVRIRLAGEGAAGERLAAREMVRTRRALRTDGGICRMAYGRRGSFAGLSRRERERAAAAAVLAKIEGYSADDTRDVLPIEYTYAGAARRGFVKAAQLANVEGSLLYLVDAKGEPVRSRRHTTTYREQIVRVIQPRGRRAAVTPAGGVSAATLPTELLETIARLVDRVAVLEAAAIAPTPAPVEAMAVEPVDGTDARDAYIAALMAERDDLRERAEAAEARAADMERVATAAVAEAKRESWIAEQRALDGSRYHATAVALQGKRGRTARRLVAARAAARTARRERIGDATARRIAEADLARLQPLAAALAALVPAAAPIAGDNVVAIRTAA